MIHVSHNMQTCMQIKYKCIHDIYIVCIVVVAAVIVIVIVFFLIIIKY